MPSPSQKSREFLCASLRHFIIWGSFLLFLFYCWSATEARKTVSNRVIDWLPDGTEELAVFFNYYSHFPEGELLMISWEGCEVDDERPDLIAQALSAPLEDGRPAYFSRVLTTSSIMEDLMSDPLDLSRKDARARLAGWLIGRNERDACLVALLAPTAELERRTAIEKVFSVTKSITGLDSDKIYIAGPSIDSVAIDKISEYSQRTLLPFFLAFCLILLLCCLRSLFAAWIVFAMALMNEELSGMLLYWTGIHVDSISLLTSSLVYVLTISAGVHMVNYYRETLQETDEVNAPLETLKKAILPCTLAAVTTVLGLGSLTVSKMVPIRSFGIISSIALLWGTAWLFLVLTSVFQQFPIRKWKRSVSENTAKKMGKPINRKRFWSRFGLQVFRIRYTISVVSLLIMFLLAFGVKSLKTTVTFHGMLPESAKVIQDYDRLQEKVGGLIPIEVMLEIPDPSPESANILEQLYLVDETCKLLVDTEGVDALISSLNFLPDLPSRLDRSFRAAGRRAGYASILNRSVDRLKEMKFYDRTEANAETSDVGVSYWRISLRISTKANVVYADLLHKIESRLQNIPKLETAAAFPNLQYQVTGGIPLVHRAQQQLLKDLIDSFVTAFGLIALTMILMLRGVVRGLIAMIPNIFPCIVIFGALGWMDIPIDMGSMMTASVAMGIAVDGTLHFLTWFNIGLSRGLGRRRSVFLAYRSCATALCQTTIVCGFGMLVYIFSDFTPVSRFSLMMCLLLTASLIGDIIILPAMLFSPIGRIFEKKSFSRTAQTSVDSPLKTQ